MRLAIASVCAILFVITTWRVENFGPQDMVQTEAGDIHRHDFVTRWGWPVPCVEHYTAFSYVYRPTGVVNATPEQIKRWSRERIAELERVEMKTHEELELLARYRASVDGHFWRMYPPAFLPVLVTWIVLVEWFYASGQQLVRVWQTRRIKSGRCLACGFDLRASPDRCPECGTVPTGNPPAT